MLQEELEIPLEPSVFWTDSTAVLKYIKNETSRFNTFLANRVTIIRAASSSRQWRYVNSSLNAADCQGSCKTNTSSDQDQHSLSAYHQSRASSGGIRQRLMHIHAQHTLTPFPTHIHLHLLALLYCHNSVNTWHNF